MKEDVGMSKQKQGWEAIIGTKINKPLPYNPSYISTALCILLLWQCKNIYYTLSTTCCLLF